MIIQQCDNGYIAHKQVGGKTIYKTLDELLNYVLLVFEGRAESFSDEKHGQVVVIRGPQVEPPVKGCGACGSALVFIRGRYPKEDNREVCPTCAVEQLERILEMAAETLTGQVKQSQCKEGMS